MSFRKPIDVPLTRKEVQRYHQQHIDEYAAPEAVHALHILIAPFVLALAGVLFAGPITIAVALTWIAHIAIDRALGYGLKLSTGFQDTHLGRIGRDRGRISS